MSYSLESIIEGLKEAESLDKRRRILSNLTKEEKQAVFGELYFEKGRELGLSGYQRYSEVNRIHDAYYLLTYACIKGLNARRVLELGCATGALIKMLRNVGREAYGIDISSYAISKSDKNVKSYLYCLDVETEKLPFKEGFFDMIVAIDVLEHVAKITYTLHMLSNLLRQGGFLLVTVPKPLPEAWNDLTHINVWTEDIWCKLFTDERFHPLPLNADYPTILKAYVDISGVFTPSYNIKGLLTNFVARYKFGRSILHKYLLGMRRLPQNFGEIRKRNYMFLLMKKASKNLQH